MIPTTNMAEITEKPLIYLGLSESGNRYYILILISLRIGVLWAKEHTDP